MPHYASLSSLSRPLTRVPHLTRTVKESPLMPRGSPNPPNRGHLKNGPGHGRTKGAKDRVTRERWEQEVRYIALSNIVDAFDAAHGNKRTFTLRELRAMP